MCTKGSLCLLKDDVGAEDQGREVSVSTRLLYVFAVRLIGKWCSGKGGFVVVMRECRVEVVVVLCILRI